MTNLRKRLSRLYSEDVVESLATRIEARVNQTKQRKLVRKDKWDEKDIVLITYGDQFKEESKKTLPTFKKMYDRYLKSTFEVVHFLPFYPYSSDDGFSVIDYKAVNPELGDWEDIKEMEQSARLMFDFVCNHMSAKSEWFKRYLAGDKEFQNFFVEMDPDTDLSSVTRPRATPVLTPFQFASGKEGYIWTTFSEDQIDLNFACPEVLYKMIDVLMFYLEEGAEYVRLDAVGFMWKVPGTSSIHLDETHEIVKLFRDLVDMAAPGTIIITETNVPHVDNISYFGNGEKEAHMVYQFPLPPLVLHAIHHGNAEFLSNWAKNLELPEGKRTFFNFLASHDGIGLNPVRGIIPEAEILALVDDLEKEGALVSYKQNPDGTKSPYEINVTYMDALSKQADTDDLRLSRFLVAHAVLMSIPGVPAVYVQSILGSRNDYSGVETTGHNRSINRKKYDLAEITAELNQADSLRKETYDALTKLISTRKAESLFHPEIPMEVLESTAELFVVKRSSDAESIILIHNLSEKEVSYSLDSGVYTNLYKGSTVTGSDSIKLRGYEFCWLKTKNYREEQK
ncbi:sugar phosphorylase [Listeria innocua]|uniref:Sucrose phosphorylase n=1 Tax=Listeria innocua serovar 6a (strain ATCC BAA-680 / CLIP 11262) TaxID=272626 RepID=Q926R8_LISIN|nr:sugar phosphorylase [Listeria innocua]EAD5703943.1 sugar phosphorylase [Listeria innocua]EAD5752390.1 sugar phosphorylase [Listeria innocua]ECC1680477.1 sugar phosphorylase [Listeria innocua]EEQ0537150.1 sugar phosphorylase [Listeria innocua]EFO6642416.1 sugar phosphorylase [Listeria innocua]